MQPDLQRRVQRYGWDKAANYYESSWKRQLKPAQDKLLEMAALKPGEKVLETACGTGLVTIPAAKTVDPGGEIVATDLSDVMVEIAQKRARDHQLANITFAQMDAEQLDLDDNRFDAAISGLGLMYVPDPVQALREMNRVLKHGRDATVAVWGERKNCGWADIFPIVDRQVASDVCPMFFQQGTGDTLKHSLETAGFTNIRVERFAVTISYASKDEALMAAFAGGPVALAYRKFDDKTKDTVHGEYLDSIAPYKNDTGYNIPGEFVVANAVKN